MHGLSDKDRNRDRIPGETKRWGHGEPRELSAYPLSHSRGSALLPHPCRLPTASLPLLAFQEASSACITASVSIAPALSLSPAMTPWDLSIRLVNKHVGESRRAR